jgi:hypothetical protein
MLGVLMMFCIEEDFGENKGKEKMKTWSWGWNEIMKIVNDTAVVVLFLVVNQSLKNNVTTFYWFTTSHIFLGYLDIM